MPTYKWVCPVRDETTSQMPHTEMHIHAPIAARDDFVGHCVICGARMVRALEAPQRTPGAWYTGKR